MAYVGSLYNHIYSHSTNIHFQLARTVSSKLARSQRPERNQEVAEEESSERAWESSKGAVREHEGAIREQIDKIGLSARA